MKLQSVGLIVMLVVSLVGGTPFVLSPSGGTPGKELNSEPAAAIAAKAGASHFREPAIQDQEPVQPNATSFMARKLDHSREIVAGLATEDYDKISSSAQRLMLLSHESEWQVIQGEDYARMSTDFRDSAKRLRDAANGENLDGSTLAYFEVTLNCVRCHKFVRRKGQENPLPTEEK